MMYFALPMPPNIANGRMHWRTKHRAKLEYWALLDSGARISSGTGMVRHLPPEKPLEHCLMTVKMYVGRKHDQDNAVARCKWAIDWLVTRGYLRDDSEKHLKWMGFPEQVIDRKMPRLEITLEPVK